MSKVREQTLDNIVMASDALRRSADNLSQAEEDHNRSWVYIRMQIAYAIGRLNIALKLAAGEDEKRLRGEKGKPTK